MKSFIKMFFAALLAIMVFALVGFIILSGMIVGTVKSGQKTSVSNNSILVIDLSLPLKEQPSIHPLNALLNRSQLETEGLHELVRLIGRASGDDRIRGLFLKADEDPHGLATDEEIRRAILQFRKSGKFVYAYGEVIPQNAYYVAAAADKVFLHPQGFLDFRGFAVQQIFLKGTLDQLDIQPQVFYVGQFKSATEPLRVTSMTEANKIQTRDYLGDLYNHYLSGISEERNIDTSTLFHLADSGMIRSAADALQYSLVDGLMYDDEVREALRQRIGADRGSELPLISASRYGKANPVNTGAGNRVAILYAQGDIVSGTAPGGADAIIASEDYIEQIRKLREDSSVRAIVLRVNSPGGSALAADGIWRALLLTKQVKPVVVSMGDYAASGGYYISCMADSIFAEANTLTGSIGVFGVIPNLEGFFKNKLGITFDGVKTARYADMGSIARPLSEAEKGFIQAGIDSVYQTFLSRVAEGRHMSTTAVDSLAQGRVWSGMDALRLGLVDRMGGLQAAVACAARMAGMKTYAIREYPKPSMPFEKWLGGFSENLQSRILEKELGEQYDIYKTLRRVKENQGIIQARIPADIRIR